MKSSKEILNVNQLTVAGIMLGDGFTDNNDNKLYIKKHDKDYFDYPYIASYIACECCGTRYKRDYGIVYDVDIALPSDMLCKRAFRYIPIDWYDRNLYNKPRIGAFLQGLYSANGSGNKKRICLVQTSYTLITQAQDLLKKLKIYTKLYSVETRMVELKVINKFISRRKSYYLEISRKKDIKRFKKLVGFLQHHKM